MVGWVLIWIWNLDLFVIICCCCDGEGSEETQSDWGERERGAKTYSERKKRVNLNAEGLLVREEREERSY